MNHFNELFFLPFESCAFKDLIVKFHLVAVFWKAFLETDLFEIDKTITGEKRRIIDFLKKVSTA